MERIYTVPLRRAIVDAPKYKRSAKAIRVLKSFIKRHMKSDNIIISSEVNQKIWEKGAKHPPGKIKVKAIKDESGKVVVKLEA